MACCLVSVAVEQRLGLRVPPDLALLTNKVLHSRLLLSFVHHRSLFLIQ